MKRRVVISFIIFVLVLSFFVASDTGNRTLRQLGSVIGLYASVEPNEYNTLAQQLEEQKAELDKQKLQIEQEKAQLQQEKEDNNDITIIYVTSIGGLLLVLVLLNYFLDWRRRK